MRNFVKNLYSVDKPFSVPDFIGQRESFICPECNRRVMVAVPATGIDWKKVANEYKGYASKMWEQCNTLLAEAGVDTLLEKQMREVLERCRRELGL